MKTIEIKHLHADIKIPVSIFFIEIEAGVVQTKAFKAAIGDTPCTGYLVPEDNFWVGYVLCISGRKLYEPYGGWTYRGNARGLGMLTGLSGQELRWVGMDLYHPLILEGSPDFQFQFLVTELYDSITGRDK